MTKQYQSEYRQQRFPTLSASQTALNQLDTRSESTVSLQSNISDVGPLNFKPDENRLMGAYNLPKQRTSWEYQSMENVGNGIFANEISNGIGQSTESLGIESGPPGILGGQCRPSFPPAYGSLDRRLFKQRSLGRISPKTPPTPLASQSSPTCQSPTGQNLTIRSPSTVIRPIEHSPKFAQRRLDRKSSVPELQMNAVEVCKPLEASDLIKYSSRLRHQRQHVQPASPLVGSLSPRMVTSPPTPTLGSGLSR